MKARMTASAAVGASLMTLAGCSAPHQIMDRQDFLAEAARSFPGENRERIVAAAETVLQHSDPGDWDVRYTINGFTGLRRYMVYAVLASQHGREKWEFQTEQPTPGRWNASVSVSETGVTASSYHAQTFDQSMASVPLYRLFWDRVDYVLGRRPDWVSCEQATAQLQGEVPAVALGGLCGATSGGRAGPPPPQMEPMAPAVAVGRGRRTS